MNPENVFFNTNDITEIGLGKNINWGIRFLYFIFPIIVHASFIFYLSSLKSLSVPSFGINFEDKLIHLIEYFIFGWLLVRALHFGKPIPVTTKVMVFTVIIGFLYGISDEIHQYFTPGRYFDLWDWVADAIGIVIGLEFYRRFYRFDLRMIQFANKTVER